ncbi:MAG: electron transfer flavoprotein subunit beta/FixA family protein, partial [Anaerolineales bacterium]
MRNPHIAVCMKVTPKPEEIRVDQEAMVIRREGVRSEINPPDMNAIEFALQLKDRYGGKLSIISMGPMFFESYLRAAMAMGADELYLLSDRAFGGADTLATTYVLARAIQKLEDVDLVVCGEESSDGATGQVPSGLAEWLNWPAVTLAAEATLEDKHIIVEREAHGRQRIQTQLPAVVAVKTAANQPRFMDFDVKDWAFEKVTMTVWDAKALEAEPERIGWDGSPTSVSGLREAESRDRRREILAGSPDE